MTKQGPEKDKTLYSAPNGDDETAMLSDSDFWELLGNPLVSGGAAVSPENEGCTVGAVMEGDGGR